ncbi:MAG: hypothetical protein RMM98_15280 [Acidobacteriota bacterium]|nr:hypothetical protein [Blastocatellia bacterium]MDW8240965.1 hypothetical protein [Acidobacteriota bacterium]
MTYSSIFVYPWDVADEGEEHVLRTVKEKIGVSSISIAVTYHAGKFLLPHNPRRRVYFPEDGVLYFRPRARAFAQSEIKPRVASLVTEKNLLPVVIEKAQRLGIRITGWMVCLHNSYLGSLYPQYAAQNVYGDRYFFSLCPSHDAVRRYVCIVLSELLQGQPLDAVELESLGFMGFRYGFHHEAEGLPLDEGAEFLLSLCFCEACKKRSLERGVNGNRLQRDIRTRLDRFLATSSDPLGSLRETIDGIPGLSDYLRVRHETVEHFLRQLWEIAQGARTRLILFTLPDVINWTMGIELPRLGHLVSAVEVAYYRKATAEMVSTISAVRDVLPRQTELYIALRPSFPDGSSVEELKQKVAYGRRAGATGFSFYNYGLIRETDFGWIKVALADGNKD